MLPRSGDFMSFLARFLGVGDTPKASTEPRSMHPLLAELQAMEPERARYLAAFAYVMARVAAADRIIDPSELDAMRRILMDEGDLPQQQAELVVSLASAQAKEKGGSQDYVITRRLAELTPRDERERVLDCAVAVAAADRLIDGHEEKELRGIARQLGFSDARFLKSLNRFRDLRSVLQPNSSKSKGQ
jgi:tellurite resistance protein